MVEIISSELITQLFKIILSIILGGLIGIEREFTHHSAGFRTHILVSVGSTLFMLITYINSLSLPSNITINLDATRIAAGVITGIGFLGAGVIFKEGANVKGLTTAATIWVTAGVGLLVGIGSYTLAIIATILILFVLFSDYLIEERFFKFSEVMFLKITFKNIRNQVYKIEKILKGQSVKFFLIDFTKDNDILSLKYKIIIRKINREPISKLLLKDKNVLNIEWTD